MQLLPTGIYNLSYNEKQRMFHFSNEDKLHEPLYWVRLKVMSHDECIDFCEFMDKKYVNGRVTGILPELSIVRLELKLYFGLKKYRRKLSGRI